VILGLIAAGLTPLVFWEGQCDSRFEIIADVPRATCIYWFERSDMFRAKAVLGNITCLRGNVPASMLIAGSVHEVRDYCRKLIEVVGKDGGFMLDASTGIPEEAKNENVFAMFRAAQDFGRYD
jgi:uroporphyrinogen-III decarboxylase